MLIQYHKKAAECVTYRYISSTVVLKKKNLQKQRNKIREQFHSQIYDQKYFKSFYTILLLLSRNFHSSEQYKIFKTLFLFSRLSRHAKIFLAFKCPVETLSFRSLFQPFSWLLTIAALCHDHDIIIRDYHYFCLVTLSTSLYPFHYCNYDYYY